MLDLHFPRHQERATLHVGRRLLLTHLFNRGRPMLFEVGSEREQKIFVERSTCSLQGTARVCYSRSSKPTLNPHPCGISQVRVSCFKGTALQCSIPGGNPCETLSDLRSPSPPRSSASTTTAVWRKNKRR